MYFVEKLIKIFSGKKKIKNNYIQKDIEFCSHLFVPIDSSGEYLACTKCGKLIKRDKK